MAGLNKFNIWLASLCILLTVVEYSWGTPLVNRKPSATVDEVNRYLDGIQADPVYGTDFTCNPPLHFQYSKLNPKSSTFQVNNEFCAFAEAFDAHYFQGLSNFWPLANRFGLEITVINEIKQFNASFNPRPILNKPAVPHFSLLYLPFAALQPQYAIWTHETGHAVLQEILENQFYPVVRTNIVRRFVNPSASEIEMQAALDKLNDEAEEIRSLWSTSSGDKQGELARRQAAMSFRAAVLKQALEDKWNPLSNSALPPFNEFFADLFAVLYHQNPNTIGDSFEALGMDAMPDWRRFVPHGDTIPAKGWSQFEAHFLLTPARHFLGQKIYPKIRDPKVFIQKLANYIVEILKAPSESLYLSSDSLIDAVNKSTTPEEIANSISAWTQNGRLISGKDVKSIKLFCQWNFNQCKKEVLDQLKLGHQGIFQTALNPEVVNQKLIEDLPTFVN